MPRYRVVMTRRATIEATLEARVLVTADSEERAKQHADGATMSWHVRQTHDDIDHKGSFEFESVEKIED